MFEMFKMFKRFEMFVLVEPIRQLIKQFNHFKLKLYLRNH